MRVQFDAHVHVHAGFDVGGVCDAACDTARRVGSPLFLCLAESEGGGDFGRVRTHAKSATTAELGSLRLGGDPPTYLVYGRQIVSNERLEVLALALDPAHPLAAAPNGEGSTRDLVERVLESGALAVLPWGVGKWLGARGTIARELAATPALWRHPRFFLGDIAARARLVPAPRPFREPVRILVGSDPLDLAGGGTQVGVYRNEVEMTLDPERPAASLVRALEAGTPIARAGRALSRGHAIRDQVRLRIAPRGSAGAGGGVPSATGGDVPATAAAGASAASPGTVGDVDLAVIGAGIHGAAAAYEAVRRGYSVLLVDRGDLGGETSSNSLKILHGGLRYLQHGNIARSRESVRERRRWLRLAPFLVAPLPCRLEERGVRRLLLRAGLLVNDALSADRNRDVVVSRRLPRSSGDTWHDAIVLDTERLLLALVHSASALAGDAFSVRVHEAATVEPAGNLQLVTLAGGDTVRATRVIRSTGLPDADVPAGLSMNLVLDRPPLEGHVAVALPHPQDGRNVFVVPWRGFAMVGTYDRDYPHDASAPLHVEPAWVDEVLRWIAPCHPSFHSLSARDVRLVHAGVLPRTENGRRLRDDAVVAERTAGVVDVVGVKYTTAYGVASRAVDLAMRDMPERAERAALDSELVDIRPRIAAHCRECEGGTEPLGAGGPLLGEVLFAVRCEWARTLEDVLLRRTASASAGHPGREVVRRVARVLAEELGWSEDERIAAVGAFDARPQFAGNTFAATRATEGAR